MVETVWRHAEVKLKLITLIKCAKRRGVDERSFASLFREIPKDVEKCLSTEEKGKKR